MDLQIPTLHKRSRQDFDTSPAAMKGKVLGAQSSTTHSSFLEDNYKDSDVKLYATQDEANADLAAGRLDAVLADSVVILDWLNGEEGSCCQHVGDNYTDAKWFGEGAGMAVRQEDEALKEKLSQRLLAKLYEHFPHLEGRIDYYELSTTLSTDWFCRYPQGEIYGLDHDPQRLQQDWLGPRTRIPGLWLTGQDTLTCGVTGAMMAGMLTTMSMVGPRKMAPLMKRIYGETPA